MQQPTEIDKNFIDQAFVYAKKALEAQEVPVGCIFVHDHQIIAVGSNTVNLTKNATRHAEFNCIDGVLNYCNTHKLNSKEFFAKISVYVTVEPCVMCMAALYDLRVKEIVFSCKNDRFGGKTVFDVSGVLNNVTTMKSGYRDEDGMNLLKEFYKGTNPSAPLSKVKIKNI